MRKYSLIYTGIAMLVLAVFSAETLSFAGAEDIKARMQARLPDIVQMKAAGIIGEDNSGFLQFVPGAANKMQDVVAAENKDRRMVYEAIAKQQGTTAELVGRRRAIQIAEKAAPGEWLQDASGKWYKK